MSVHFVGIKGVGMTPLAIIAKEAGFEVTGSDIGEEFITDEALKNAGIVPTTGFSKENILSPDLVIITGAHGGMDNPEAIAAKEKNIKVITQGEAVGIFMKGDIFGKNFTGVSVAGTHGKTTTTAMIATILKENQVDPSFIIGTGDVGTLGAPGHLGQGKYFIAEADEYATEPKHNRKPKFLWQNPKFIVLTNIEFDHPDIYESLDAIRNAYLSFAMQMSKDGELIACGDDPEIKKLLKEYTVSGENKRVITYGFNVDNDYILEKVHISGEHMFFSVSSRDTVLSDFMLKVVGEHNALNALAAIVLSLETGLRIDKIKKGLLSFTGSKRRLEYMGELATGAKVYDDYAHHPTEIKKTLEALKSQYPNKKIVAIFQPHTYSRTKKLFDEFISSFQVVDAVILSEIYPSLREAPDLSVSSLLLSDRIKDQHKDVIYRKTIADVVKYINEKRFRSDTVLVTMGAGDIYKIHKELNFA